MNFAGPFDLGVYGAVNNWFVAGRRLASAITTAGHTIGLTVMPLIVAGAFAGGSVFGLTGWRGGWVAIGLTVLVVGFLPWWMLMVRRGVALAIVSDRECGTAYGWGRW